MRPILNAPEVRAARDGGDLSDERRAAIDELLHTLAGCICDGDFDADPETGDEGYPFLKAALIDRFALLGVDLSAAADPDDDEDDGDPEPDGVTGVPGFGQGHY